MHSLNSRLLIAINEAVHDLELTYGINDPGVVDAKHVLCECLFANRLIDAPEDAALSKALREKDDTK